MGPRNGGPAPGHAHRGRRDESLISPDRRGFLRLAGLAGLGWLTPVGHLLAARAERAREPARSIILIWLAGGPSQLETFDPHPGTRIAGGTRAIPTAVRGVRLAEGFARLAEVMTSVSLVRSLVSQEGDHERGTYHVKTGYRPDPTVVHPALGAICCHELPEGGTSIPRHVSILPSPWPGRGGFLGGEYDAFQVDDPAARLPDVVAPVAADRDARRVGDLDVVERAFARGRLARVEATLHRDTVRRARAMMASEQLRAFDLADEPARLRGDYGATPFGRACLAARRLTEVGVRCVEVTLGGWDSHVNNHEVHRGLVAALDPALERPDRRPPRPRRPGPDRRRLRRRVRPDAEGQPARRTRPLAQRLQPGDRRGRAPRRPGRRRDRPRGDQGTGRPAPDRRRPRHDPDGRRPRPRARTSRRSAARSSSARAARSPPCWADPRALRSGPRDRSNPSRRIAERPRALAR